MWWKLILKDFGHNIQHVSGVDSIVDDTLSRLPYTSVDKNKPSTSKAQCHTNNLFTIVRVENNKDCFPLNILSVQIEQQKYLSKINYKLSAYILYQGSGYSKLYIGRV